ncbi:YlqD family protein [Bacillus sp. B1-b2]|uniref:YlqD family protein n=1 Tax=Bacillus sp. B1-b2 TaxID=2653201 RepID=UPI001261A569|nr:YlqD family protein [Bacillus sp. B1-b2]KAB7668617.1 hypothetical protein F9279_12335 [Bacillus sp. B1-b2]
MKILQSITVNQVLTEQKKTSLAKEYQEEIWLLEREIQQLQFEEKKQLRNHSSPTEIQKKFQREVHNRIEKRKTIEFQLEQLHILPIGTEIKDHEVLAVLDIQVGDKWEQPNKSILIKDGIIVEIR